MSGQRAIIGRISAVGAATALVVFAVFQPSWAGVEEGRVKAQTCVACHGPAGNSAIPTIPSLSGQPKQFLVSALFQFREGKRINPQMSPFAASLTNADMNDLAAYFSTQLIAVDQTKTSAPVAAKGRQLSVENNCVACHAANLMGQQHIPRIAGLHKDYLREQLRSFKASTRGEMDGVMTSAAQALTAQDIDVLADYLSGLPTSP